MRQTILSVGSELKQIDNAIAVAKSPWIFPSRRNPGGHVSWVNNAHDRLCEKAQAAGVELNLVLYDFRHTFAPRMAEEGIDLVALAKILGHSSDPHRRALRLSDG
jgi:integrase